MNQRQVNSTRTELNAAWKRAYHAYNAVAPEGMPGHVPSNEEKRSALRALMSKLEGAEDLLRELTSINSNEGDF